MLTKFKKMKIKPIKTEKDYNQALERLEVIFDAKKGTKEGDELEILGILIDNYENELFPINLPDPIEAVSYTHLDVYKRQELDRRRIRFSSRLSISPHKLEPACTTLKYCRFYRELRVCRLSIYF